MQEKYRLFRRSNGVYYWQHKTTNVQGSLKTKDRKEAARLLVAKNESECQPTLNLALGRAYLSAHDPQMIERTWQRVMDEIASHGTDSSRVRYRRAMRSKAYDPIRKKTFVQTTSDDLLTILRTSNNSATFFLRRLHDLALDFGWLPWPVFPNSAWPKIHSKTRRAITETEHLAIIAQEQNTERRAYYELLWLTDASQTDAAELAAENINACENVLS